MSPCEGCEADGTENRSDCSSKVCIANPPRFAGQAKATPYERGRLLNPPGWEGAFRKAPDGKSYIVECAIPWTLLGAGSDPPRAGDELGLCWIVNWSDASGRRWRGQLIENKNPAYAGRGEKFLTFMFAETWGKAIYK